MNSAWISILFRFIILIVLQVVVFKRILIDVGFLSFGHFFIYPLWIMLLPFKLPRPLLMVLAFVMGIVIDVFYDSPGVHAATLVFTAYARDFILRVLEPEIGFDLDQPFSLRRLGIIWYIAYAALFMIIHLFIYFSIEVFSYVYFYEIMMSTISSLIFSVSIIVIFVMISNPKY